VQELASDPLCCYGRGLSARTLTQLNRLANMVVARVKDLQTPFCVQVPRRA
jgi:hypothetical protein